MVKTTKDNEMTTPTAIAKGVVIYNNSVIIDSKIIKITVDLLKIWEEIFKGLYNLNIDIDMESTSINNILKEDTNLINNLDFSKLLFTLENSLSDYDIKLVYK
jgi:hypothetical protein